MGTVRREPIDSAVYEYFEREILSVEATIAAAHAAASAKLHETEVLAEQADHEAAQLEAQLHEIDADYRGRKLPAELYVMHREAIENDLHATRAEGDRLAANAADVREAADLRDLEAATLRRLVDARAAIVNGVRNAETTAAVRARLQLVFARFVLHPDILHATTVPVVAGVDGELRAVRCAAIVRAGTYYIEPIARIDALAGFDRASGYPVHQRAGLPVTENVGSGRLEALRGRVAP